MNVEIPAVVIGSLCSGSIVAVVSWVKMGIELDKAVTKVAAHLDRIDRERAVCKAAHDKFDSELVEHHKDDSRHISDSWRDEVRSRLARIEEIQDRVLFKLLNGAGKA